ncbi:hypothetical protein BDR06DRAFT_1012690 [Suillus hirtellus]|nr:hypothetical protein BDR06DRAFT_1012690 [Suillus hirtellus]
MPLHLPIFLRRPSSAPFRIRNLVLRALPSQHYRSSQGRALGLLSENSLALLATSWVNAKQLRRDESPLPAVHTGLFEPSFFNSNFSSQTTQPYTYYHLFFVFRIDADTTIQSFNEMTFPPHAYLGVRIPLLPLHDLSIDINATDVNPNDPSAWMSAEYNNSQASSAATHTGFLAHFDISLPVVMPQPQHAAAQFDHWKDMPQQYNVLARGLDILVPIILMVLAHYCQTHVVLYAMNRVPFHRPSPLNIQIVSRAIEARRLQLLQLPPPQSSVSSVHIGRRLQVEHALVY